MKEVQLGNAVELITKGTTPTTIGKEFYDSGVKFLRAQNVIHGKVLLNEDLLFIDTETHNRDLKRSQIKKGDVLLTIAGTIGRTAIVSQNEELNCNQAVAIIRLGESEIDPNFLCYFLSSNEAQVQFSKGKVTATISNLSLGQIKKLKIPLPPLATQKKIVAILDAADEHRQKTKQLLAKYDELAQSIFLDMFGDAQSSFKQVEIGELIRLIGGGTPSKDVNEYWNGDIPWASVKDLKSDILSTTVDSITKIGLDNSSSKLIPSGSLIIATRMAVGRAAICEMDVAINQDLKAIKIIGDINKVFLFYLLKSKGSYFDRVSSGATVKGIKIEHITKLKIGLPPKPLQNQFEQLVLNISDQKARIQEISIQSENLFNSLLQKAFKGELVK